MELSSILNLTLITNNSIGDITKSYITLSAQVRYTGPALHFPIKDNIK